MKQAERVERSTKALLDAAAEIIVDSGYEGLSIGAVGERAGYSRGLVTARFGSKDGLVDALIDQTTVRWQEQILIPSLAETPGLGWVVGTYRAMAEQWEVDPAAMLCLWALLFNAVGTGGHLRQRCYEHHEATRDTVSRWLERGQADGSVRQDVDPGAEATYELGVLRGIAFQRFVDTTFDVANALLEAAERVDRRLRSEQ